MQITPKIKFCTFINFSLMDSIMCQMFLVVQTTALNLFSSKLMAFQFICC